LASQGLREKLQSSKLEDLANLAIIAAGLVTAIIFSPWPDLIVGLGIFVVNLDAARQVFSAAWR